MTAGISVGRERPAIFITGGASGIGRACAERFAHQGWFVGIYDVDEVGATTLADSLGRANAVSGRLDVRDSNAWVDALRSFWNSSGQRLDVLFNNAGILTSGQFASTPLDRHRAMVEVNVGGMITGCHHAFSYLRQTPGAQVINMASATAIYGQPELATYSATKFAVRGLSEALNLEWREADVRVSDIWPSFVKTAMAQGFDQVHSAKKLGVGLSPENVASIVWKCANARRASGKTHWTVGMQAGFLALGARLAPHGLTRQIVRMISR